MAFPISAYQIRRTFRAPLPFVYAWCTEYTAEDRRLGGDPGARQIIRKGSRTVVYEDLNETPHGWMWSRYTVTLHPPDRWHAVAVGNYRTWNLDYSLRDLHNGRTEFTLRGKRRSTPLGVRNPSKHELETELHAMWRSFGRALERDYQRSIRRRTP